MTNVFALPNGLHQAEVHQHPINFLSDDGRWLRIKNKLVPGETPGTFVNEANSWKVTFGPTSDGVAIDAPGSSLRFAPQDAAAVAPVVGADSTSVVYADVWPNVDLVYHVVADRVEEDIVLKATPDRSSYRFNVTRPLNAGRSLGNESEPTFADPVVIDKSGQRVDKARPTISADDSSATINVDPDWLAGVRSFPMTIDPTVTVGVAAKTAYSSGGSSQAASEIGNEWAGADAYWRSVILFDYASLATKRARVTNASVRLQLVSGTTTPYTAYISDATAWSHSGVGTQRATGAFATDNTLSSSQLTSLFDGWTSNALSGGALMVQGSETSGSYTDKEFAATLSLTYDIPPPNAPIVRPSDGATVSTTTPTLAVTTPTDDDGDTVTYHYQVFNGPSGTGTPVWENTGWLSERSVQIGSPLLDGVTYSWRVSTFDNVYSTVGQPHVFRVDRRLGDDPTQASDQFGPLKVDLGNGNVTTTVATPTVSTVAGDAGVSLTYNALDVSASSSTSGVPYNWTLTAGTSAVGYESATLEANNNVLLTDTAGALHEYAINPTLDGYTPPRGEEGVLTKNTDGSLSLFDDGITYAFDAAGVLQSIATPADDLKPAALQYVYTSAPNPVRLVHVVDPARANATVIGLTYQGMNFQTCPVPPPGFDNPPLSGRLCQVTLVGGDATRFFYVNGRLARVVHIGGAAGDEITDFGYDSMGHMTAARMPEQNDWLTQAGHVTDPDMVWEVSYETPLSLAERAASITGPRPDPSVATRPRHSYTYKNGDDVGGFYAYSQAFNGGVDVASADINSDGKADIVTAPGAGGTGQVKAWTNGSWAQVGPTVTPYPGFAGAINVAAGDVNGDGKADFITGAGAGGGPDVEVRSGLDGSNLGGFYAYESTFTGGVDVAAGDTDGDGKAEIITTPGPGRAAQVKVFKPNGTLVAGPFGVFSPWTGGLRVTTVDTDYDGISEIAAGAMAGGGPRVATLRSTGAVIRDKFVFDQNFAAGVDVGGSSSGDSLAVAPLTTEALFIVQDDAAYVRSPYGAFAGGTRVAMGDLSGVAVPQTITGAGPGGGPHVRTFSPKGVTDVKADGVSPSSGFIRRVVLDDTFRQLEDRDGLGKTARTRWDPIYDRIMSITDPAGIRSTKVYDSHGRVIESNGPGTGADFNDDGTIMSGHSIGHDVQAYDAGIRGLAATYWSNPNQAGAPIKHSTGVGDASSRLVANWGLGAPSGLPSSDNWSAQFTGEIDLPTVGTYAFEVNSDDGARLFVDDQRVISDWNIHSAQWHTGSFTNQVAGRHRIRVDYFDSTSSANIELDYTPPSSPQTPVPGSALFPNYGLMTSTTVADGPLSNTPSSIATTTFSGGAIGAEFRLPVMSTVNGETTTVGYESPGAGYLRETSRTLPGGNQWTYVFYDDNPLTTGVNERQADNPCTSGTVETADNAGLLKSRTGPDSDGVGPLKAKMEEFVYDAAGRTVASVTHDAGVVPLAGDWSCITYEGRGRVLTISTPAFSGEPARTTAYSYPAPGADPRPTSVSDPVGVVTVTVDMLGRQTAYTDVWAKTTTYTFSQAGLLTDRSGPQGVVHVDYDDAGKPVSEKLDGVVVSTPSYDQKGRLNGGSYGNGVSSTRGFGGVGRPNSVTWTKGTVLASDQLAYSTAGRIRDESLNGADPNPAGDNYVYDASGRLTTAFVRGQKNTYSYAASSACGSLTTAGKNSDRTTSTWQAIDAGGTVVGSQSTYQYCYDNADRLTSSTEPTFNGATLYDAHGNAAITPTQNIVYDGGDRHVATNSGDTTVTYIRDATDRIVSRTTSTITLHATSSATNGAGSTSLSLTKPVGAALGDVLVADVVVAGGTDTTFDQVPAGWALVAGTNTNGTAVRSAVYTHVLTAGETGPWTWQWPTTPREAAGAVVAYGGVDPITPVDASTVQNNASGTSHVTPAAPALTHGDKRVAVVGLAAGATFTPPSGMNERADVASTGSARVSASIDDSNIVWLGTSNAKTVTSSVAGASVGYTIDLRPAPASVIKYSFTGPGDSPAMTLDNANVVQERMLSLIGGASLTKRSGGDVWSFANLHGDTMLTTDSGGAATGTYYYDAFGTPISGGTPDNSAGNFDYGWLGYQKRPTEHEGGGDIIEMGVRQYAPALGRFLEPDPIEGGSCNEYEYACQDPANKYDTAGTFHYTFDYDLGPTNVSSSDFMAAVANAFGPLFVVDGHANRLTGNGQTMNLHLGPIPLPVRVSRMTSTGWRFNTRPPHGDYPGWIDFKFYRAGGHMHLNVHAYVPDNAVILVPFLSNPGLIPAWLFRKRVYEQLVGRLWSRFAGHLEELLFWQNLMRAIVWAILI
jgi:RHS repeat-associated protein